MNDNTSLPLSSTLYIVSTPIGNMGDITKRAIFTLKNVNLIAAEDTRHTGNLLHHFDIQTPLISLHDHNEQIKTNDIIHRLKIGQSIALVSDAGTPLINDPGYYLVSQCRKENITVVPVPGACAVITALSVSGLPSDRFCYEGFLPAKKKARCDTLAKIVNECRTIIYYESPHRIIDSLQDIAETLGANRDIVLAKELTKRWETIVSLPVYKLIEWLQADPNRQKGEMVVLIAGLKTLQDDTISPEIIKTLTLLNQELPLKKAAALTAEIHGVKKNPLYQFGLKLQQSTEKEINED